MKTFLITIAALFFSILISCQNQKKEDATVTTSVYSKSQHKLFRLNLKDLTSKEIPMNKYPPSTIPCNGQLFVNNCVTKTAADAACQAMGAGCTPETDPNGNIVCFCNANGFLEYTCECPDDPGTGGGATKPTKIIVID